MKKTFGNISGLKATQLKQIEKLYMHKTPPEQLVSLDQLREMADISHDIRRQIGILINRSGKTEYVITGDAHRIVIPVTPGYQATPGKLKGLRCIHTHLGKEPLTTDDLTDLALLRLDFMAAVCLSQNGGPELIHMGHILPGENGPPYQVMAPVTINDLDMDCTQRIYALETELARKDALYRAGKGEEKALLINATTGSVKESEASLDELRELCRSSSISVIDTVIQKRKKIDSKFVLGKGRLTDLTIQAIQKHATMMIFDRELSPSQIRSITDFVEMKVIDRTQLILDIFARHAKSREGKLQVELAQMKYLLPRLVTKNTAMSRLTGGIGGRGPGETKLEINRRRVRDRAGSLKNEIKKIRKQRAQQRAKRNRTNIPVISIVGYTNAGKSTLLNTLTQSRITAANKLFATLDPSSRRLRFPRDTEVIITDTVGFIQNLPVELVEAFHATLEELSEADILLHVVDISNKRYKQQIASVETILKDLELDRIPSLYVFNKQDKINLAEFEDKWLLNHGVVISATKKETIKPLVSQLEEMISRESCLT
ncbi:MAG: GTPase HflX [Thermodesulfobacteriota bacterium]|nr:GTPase HflX [Thermodesulfobacteriota bacterium]